MNDAFASVTTAAHGAGGARAPGAGPLHVSRSDVERQHAPDECIVAAAAVYRRALEHGEGTRFSFNA